MKKIRNQNGFTLIELMIAVAIIGILAAIAIPQYSDFTKRAHVSEGLSLASSAKLSVSEYYAMNNSTFPEDNAMAGLGTAETIKGNAVSSVKVGKDGIITITYSDKLGTANQTIILTPTVTQSAMVWSCTGGSLEDNLRPSNCR